MDLNLWLEKKNEKLVKVKTLKEVDVEKAEDAGSGTAGGAFVADDDDFCAGSGVDARLP